MNSFAVILTGGKQYIAKVGDTLVVDKLGASEKNKVEFDKVLLYVDEANEMHIGKPYLSSAKVMGEVVKQDKGEKVRVARFKAKSRYRKVRGFRPELTAVKITSIKV